MELKIEKNKIRSETGFRRMKLPDCVVAAVIGYIAIIVGCLGIGILWFIVVLPPETIFLMALSAVIVAPLIMGFVLGLRWPHRTIAFDEILPACLKTLLIFGAPWLIAPPAIPYYLLALPFGIAGTIVGTKIGIAARHYRLIDELLGRWTAGEK